MLLEQLTDDVLDAFDGICYAVSPDGRISGVGPENWNRFAESTGTKSLRPQEIRTRNLFEFIASEQVADHYRRIMEALRRPEVSEWVMHFRCDGPDRKRGIRLAIRPLREDDTLTGYVFQSVILEESLRPNLDILDFEALQRGVEQAAGRPLVMICSYCQRIKDENHTGGDWAPAEYYYARGGDSRVRLSHAVCPACCAAVEDSFVRH